jgi:hypothetical protein
LSIRRIRRSLDCREILRWSVQVEVERRNSHRQGLSRIVVSESLAGRGNLNVVSGEISVNVLGGRVVSDVVGGSVNLNVLCRIACLNVLAGEAVSSAVSGEVDGLSVRGL